MWPTVIGEEWLGEPNTFGGFSGGYPDEIMLGDAKLDYSKLMMQLDSETGRYEDIGEQTLGHKGRSLSYRKIQNLEHDDRFKVKQWLCLRGRAAGRRTHSPDQALCLSRQHYESLSASL